jgi:hypothetical protein
MTNNLQTNTLLYRLQNSLIEDLQQSCCIPEKNTQLLLARYGESVGQLLIRYIEQKRHKIKKQK